MLYRPAQTEAQTIPPAAKVVASLRANWAFHLVVTLPTLLTAAYLYMFAANQYASEAQYLVRTPQAVAAPSLMGEVLGAVTQRSSEETTGVAAFLTSHDALAGLKKQIDVEKVWRRPALDIFNRVRAHPSAEDLLKYYRKRVTVSLNANTGITTLQVKSFRPEDSQAIANALLKLGEDQVNKFAAPAQTDAVRVAETEVERARARTLDIADKLTSYRNQQQTLDPAASTAMLMTVIGGLEGDLATARAERNAASQYLKPGTPKLAELDNKISALAAQVAQQRARLTGGTQSLSPTAAGYDRMMLDREFAAKDYASALGALEVARADASKKHLYLVRVVEPNKAEKSLYPRRGLILISTLISLLVIYGIGWLIIAGIREHAS